jgi:ubiquitin C-terminal hydrolase
MVLDAYCNLLRAMANSPRFVEPSELKTVIDCSDDTFAGTAQHDANQFLVSLLSLIHEDLNQAPFACDPTLDLDRYSGMELHRMMNQSIVSDLFHGQQRTTIKYACNHQHSIDEPLVYWSLPVPQNCRSDLIDCIALWRCPGGINGNEMMCCPKCAREGKCIREVLVVKFPKLLIVQLKRFVTKGAAFRKNSTVVSYPKEFDSSAYAAENTGIYDLTALIMHSGSVNSGHYTCLVRDPEDTTKWFQISDESVAATCRPTAEGISEGNTMTLFYQNRSAH